MTDNDHKSIKIFSQVKNWGNRLKIVIGKIATKLKPYFKPNWLFAYLIIALFAIQLALLTNPQLAIAINSVALIGLVAIALWRNQALRFWRSSLKYLTKKFRPFKPYFKQFWVFVYILAAILATQLTLLSNARVGVYINAVAFMALVGLALWREAIRPLAISAAILPVATMVCLSLPANTNRFTLAVVYYNVILLLALLYRYLFTLDHPLSLSKLSLRGYELFLPLMIVVGQLLGGIGYLMLQHQYTYDLKISLVLVAAASVVFACAEETLFRGLIQQRGSRILHPGAAAVLSALLFTTASIGHTSNLVVVFTLISGIVLSTIYYFKQNLVLTITANSVSKLTYLALLATFVIK